MFSFIFEHIFKRALESLALASNLFVLGFVATSPRQLGPWPWTFSEALALASSLFVLGFMATCPRQLGPWPWTFSESLALASDLFRVFGLGLEGCILAPPLASTTDKEPGPGRQTCK